MSDDVKRGVKISIWFHKNRFVWIKSFIISCAFKVTGLHYKTDSFPIIKDEWIKKQRPWWSLWNR